MKPKVRKIDRNPMLGHRLEDGSRIVNERCRCGHMRTEHGERYEPGHGACEEVCNCQQFTWTNFVTVKGVP